jgi:multiple sugar transport system permease protein
MGTTMSKRGQARPTKVPARSYYSRKRARDRRTFLILVAPAAFLFVLMMFWPLGNMFHLSTLEWNGIVKPQTFIGLGNFVEMFGDRHFQRAVVNTGIHLLISMPAVMLPAFMLGFFLSQRRPGHRIFRTIFFSPSMISVAAIALMFLGIYMPDGIINTLLRSAGLDNLTRLWLGDPKTVLLAIIAIDLWSGIGFFAVLFFAALTNVPEELYEAAILDGASRWKIMWCVAFPLTLDFFGVASMLHFLWILLGSAQNVLLLTKGGPGDYSLTLPYLLYKEAFMSQRLGYSQAIGVFIFGIGIIGMLLIRFTTQRAY